MLFQEILEWEEPSPAAMTIMTCSGETTISSFSPSTNTPFNVT
jgi:hypothetical protein